MKIYMVRHTSVGVPKGTCYGQTNVPLAETFAEEASIVKQNLQGINFGSIYSSPLSRCRKLAEFCGYGDVAEFHDRLKEIHMGDWEMHLWDDLDMTIWEEDWVNVPPPHGESFAQMYQRVSNFLDMIKQDKEDNKLIFTHGGVISCASVYFGQADIKSTFDLMPQYGEIVVFDC